MSVRYCSLSERGKCHFGFTGHWRIT